jgi:hypothetical protein
MFDDCDAGVAIANGRSGVRLSRVGEANEFGYPTLIEVRAGPFTGAVRDCTVGDYSIFLEHLESLHSRLVGAATLGSFEGFNLSLTGSGHGGIDASAVIVGEHVPSIRLTFEFPRPELPACNHPRHSPGISSSDTRAKFFLSLNILPLLARTSLRPISRPSSRRFGWRFRAAAC